MHWRAYVCTREKVLPASLLDRESAKKFALCAQNGLKLGFYACWASFFAEEPPEGPCRASLVAPGSPPLSPFLVPVHHYPFLPLSTGSAARPFGVAGAYYMVTVGGFALHEAF